MKKNLLAIIILALVSINLILTLLIIFVVVPTSNKTNRLIQQVASVINLELETTEEKDKKEEYSINDIEARKIEKELTINLKKATGDKNNHFAKIDSVTLSLNKGSKDYKKLSGEVDAKMDIIMDMVSTTFNQYTIDEVINDKEEIRNKLVKDLQTYFKSDFIVEASFGNLRAE